MKHLYRSSRAIGTSIIQGYRELACSIVFQAIEDYRNAYEVLPRKKARRVREDIKSFINSPWFGVLCDLSPEQTLAALNKGTRRGV